MPARVGLETRTAVKLRIAMSSSSATRAAGDMGLRPPSPAPTSPPPPPGFFCVIQVPSKRQGVHCPPWTSSNTRFTRSGERWLCTAAGWPARFPAASEHRKRREELRFPQRSRAGRLPADPPARSRAHLVGAGGSPARGEA